MTIDTDLATLRDELSWQQDHGNRALEHLQDFEEALDRVETELARLQDVLRSLRRALENGEPNDALYLARALLADTPEEQP